MRKVLVALILTLGILPATEQPAAAYCFANGSIAAACYPTDADSCRYWCYSYCNQQCPPFGACPTGMACESGGERCACLCENPCPCEGGC